MADLVYHPAVLAAAEAFNHRQQVLIDLCIQVQQIPAPTGDEAQRAAWVESQFERLALADIARDGLPNVYARLPGKSRSPALLVSAHTDTVFPPQTDLTIRHDPAQRRLYGPGIGDNSTGVAALLTLAETLRSLPPPPVDIWLVANCGEEGLGDLRGMRGAATRLNGQIGASVVIEGTGLKRVVHRALGSRRYRIRVTAPGGHSWSDFGSASAIHVLAQVAAAFTHLHPPTNPRTTFNIGRMGGGTSVNTIAQSAELELDLRSEEATALHAIVAQVLTIVQGVQQQWADQQVTISTEVIGDRPGGGIAEEHPLVQAAFQSLAASGLTVHNSLNISSTDANIPLSMGIPAVCIGITEGGNAHRLEEWINTDLLPVGMKHLLYLSWWATHWLAGKA
jgi:acetylornithine deacetylase/succinyl-diaminopimelate desuccinylase-like protein